MGSHVIIVCKDLERWAARMASIIVQIRWETGKTILSTAGGHFQSPNWHLGRTAQRVLLMTSLKLT